MTVLPSKHLVAVKSPLPENIIPSTVNEATGRRAFLGPETGLSQERSRSNKTCSACGQLKTGRGSVCRTCYDKKIRRVEMILRCAHCNKQFSKLRCEYEKGRRRGHVDFYCSQLCSRAHHAIKNSKPCPVCGGRKMNRNAKFCSPACRSQAATTRVLKPIPCFWCGTTFRPVSSRTAYCSKVCQNTAHSHRMRGFGNSNYKTGTSYAKWFKEMRPVILERDNFRCVACGCQEWKTGLRWKHHVIQRSNLVIHHIDEHPKNNRPDNLVTLCKTCHIVHHKSAATPFPHLRQYAVEASLCMATKLRLLATGLQSTYSSTTP